METHKKETCKPLDGVLVVAVEQAVAVPYCTSRLADAGARVIKIERPEGDFSRSYDSFVHGEATYFVWINRGKESVALNLKKKDDAAVLQAMIDQADVFIQDLAPGAAARLGFDSDDLRARNPRLITCDVSGYGESGPLHQMKAHDLLIQAESGLVSVSGTPGEWSRIGVSLCDINAGMNALIGIQQALLQREKTGKGSAIKVSLFGTAAELMAVPYLQTLYSGKAPARVGLRHPDIAPYGVFTCADGRDIVISIQNEREWALFCEHFLIEAELATDPRFDTPHKRLENRQAIDEIVQQCFSQLTHSRAIKRLSAACTGFASVNSVHDLISHPQLRKWPMPVNGQIITVPAPPYETDWDEGKFASAPAIDQHGEAIRTEFSSQVFQGS